MGTGERYHYWLRVAALSIAAFNLLSVFLLDLREWLVYFHPIPWRVLVWPTFVVALPALPFLLPADRNSPAGTATIRWLLCISLVTLCFEALWLLQIAIATFCRGPYWTFYWPWEVRHGNPTVLNNVDLSEYFWILGMDRPRPEEFWTREAPGIPLVACHFVLIPAIATCILRYRSRSIAVWRLALLTLMLQLLTFMALKIAINWQWHVRYIIAWPDGWSGL